jgi:four helix bundle protein
MSTFQRFEEIEAWQMARELTREIYSISNQGSFAKDFGLRDQIRRASVSVMSNIAEGFERGGKGEFVQFLSMAKGSAGEVRSHLYVALDQGYISRETFDRVFALADRTGRIIRGLMSYLSKTNIKGIKYKRADTQT